MEQTTEEKKPPRWLSVPQFGDWDQTGALPDYSMDFSKIREMRKQNKRDPSRASLGNDMELAVVSTTRHSNNSLQNHHHAYPQNHSRMARRSIFRYFTCCGMKKDDNSPRWIS